MDRAWGFQPCWTQENRLMAYLEYTIYDYSGTIIRRINIEKINNYVGGGIIEGQFSHPSWAPDGERIACYREGDIWVYNIKELIDDVLDREP